jgi:hypothetical protein
MGTPVPRNVHGGIQVTTMNLDRLIKEVRPTGGVLEIGTSRSTVGPVIAWGRGVPAVEEFAALAPKLPYGSVALIYDVDDAAFLRADQIADVTDFRTWHRAPNFPGLPDGSRTWIKSHWQNTYTTHLPYLLEAVKRTTGPVLELGAGEGSTPVLHTICVQSKRLLVTVDSETPWLERFERTHGGQTHYFVHNSDPAETEWLDKDWSVVFVDHAPGGTRKRAIERARARAEYTVVHDSEDIGYDIEDLLSTFKHRRDFRYARPWTTVVSEIRAIDLGDALPAGGQ